MLLNELIEKCENLKPMEEFILQADELRSLFDPYNLGDLVFQYNLQEFIKKQGCFMVINDNYIKVQK